ncbi:MAG: cytochrome c oxidase subunit II [Candidatus Eisenbacteria bacterium]|uniref:Cytochrome c oxidase subunit 2 n=1 Tax=Eiseniibacteriota bacterium TaxID=2212470 RepID=A0A7Y2H3L0_UNCEI|nr:cytochrome c oxidase subunit II [Candidatus Eisenbacteria bacterium]
MNGAGTLQLPPQASTVAADIDALYYFIFWGCAIAFILVMGGMFFFMAKYRRREGVPYKPSPSHNTPLEVTWTVVPFLLLMVVFVWGFKGYMDLHITPANAMEYSVRGKQWLWQVNTPGVSTASVNEMVVPVNTPIKVLLQSDDVIHSFFVPDFRVKMDAYPNQYTTMWFEATKTGEFDMYCTEYCGTEHSQMFGKVIVKTQAEFEEWMGQNTGRQEDQDPAEYGEGLFVSKTCATCHSIDGSTALTGPSFKGLWGSQESLADGSSVLVDENYLRESMLEPNAKVVAGYEGVMPTFTGLLTDDDIFCLIEYIKTLQ